MPDFFNTFKFKFNKYNSLHRRVGVNYCICVGEKDFLLRDGSHVTGIREGLSQLSLSNHDLYLR